MSITLVDNSKIVPATPLHRARSTAPVFVIGCSRSGTTLLYHMLLSSGNFAVYRMESQILTLFEPRFRPLSKHGNKRKMLDAWYGTRLYQRSGLEPEEIEPRIMAECQNGGDFLRILMEEMCRKQGVQRWAETTPEHLLYMRRIKETIPNALIVHVIRDGRDVALSWEKLSQIRRFPWDRRRAAMAAGIYWEWIVNKGRQAGRTLGGDYVEVLYEDLVHKPAEVLKNLEPFIDHDLDYDRITEVGIGSVSKPNTAFKGEERSPIGRWKTDLSPEELAVLETLTGGALDDLGYERSTKVPRSLDLARMRASYRAYFESKQYLKTRTPAGKWLVKRNLSWV
jgi:Sulfotransferase family